MAKTNTTALLVIGGVGLAAVAAAYYFSDEQEGGSEAESVTQQLGDYTLEVIRKNGQVSWFALKDDEVLAGGSGESPVEAMSKAREWAKENE